MRFSRSHLRPRRLEFTFNPDAVLSVLICDLVVKAAQGQSRTHFSKLFVPSTRISRLSTSDRTTDCKMKFNWSQRREYHNLPSDEHDEDLSASAYQEKLSPASVLTLGVWRIALPLITLFLSLAILAFAVTDSRHHHGTSISSLYPDIHSSEQRSHFLTHSLWNYSSPSPCGSTPDQARSAGCQWSPMTFAWYPPACYDGELVEEFLALDDWAWFSTEELQAEDKLDREAIMRGDVKRAFMSMKYHKLHCMYMMRKLYRALMGVNGLIADNYALTIGHLEHCERFVLRDDHPAVKGTYSVFGINESIRAYRS